MKKNSIQANKRVVITGCGVLSSNAHGLSDFEQALREQRSGIRYIEELAELGFAAQVGALPQKVDEKLQDYFTETDLLAMNDASIYGSIAAIDATKDAQIELPSHDCPPDTDAGAIIGTGLCTGLDTLTAKILPRIAKKQIRRLGSTAIEQIMGSSVSAKVGGLLGLGNLLTTNSSACATGTEAIIHAYHWISSGRAVRMLAGASEAGHPYQWAGFDSMRLLNRKFNQEPHKASRPLSASSAGFVPGAGAGVLHLETLESAENRAAPIYAEIIGTAINSGGQRQGGSITAPNPQAVQQNMTALIQAEGLEIEAKEINYINGHLTGSFADPLEVSNWSKALKLSAHEFPYINASKSLIGHGIGAAGALECIATLIQMKGNFIHASVNCEDLVPEVEDFQSSIVREHLELKEELKIAAKSSFGFGDVNSTILFEKYSST